VGFHGLIRNRPFHIRSPVAGFVRLHGETLESLRNLTLERPLSVDLDAAARTLAQCAMLTRSPPGKPSFRVNITQVHQSSMECVKVAEHQASADEDMRLCQASRGYKSSVSTQSDRRAPTGPDGMSWPSTGSGFEADQFSPAGEIQRVGWLAETMHRPGALRRAARFNLVTKLMVVLMVLMALLVVGVLLASGISAL
jgi:hypothetical protein